MLVKRFLPKMFLKLKIFKTYKLQYTNYKHINIEFYHVTEIVHPDCHICLGDLHPTP